MTPLDRCRNAQVGDNGPEMAAFVRPADLALLIALADACVESEKRGEIPPQRIYTAYVALITKEAP